MSPSTTPLSILSGLIGLAVLAAGIGWTALEFRNTDGRGFNPLYNFVSELGSAKASHAAAVFNLSIIFSSLLLAPLVYTLASHLDGRVRWYARAAGICSLTGSVGVGFATMDHIGSHLVVAMLFFWGWLATSLIFTVGLWRKYSFRQMPGLLLAGVVSALAAGLFLTALITALIGLINGAFNVPQNFQRPAVWDIAVLEWCVVLSFGAWIIMAALHLKKTSPSPP